MKQDAERTSVPCRIPGAGFLFSRAAALVVLAIAACGGRTDEGSTCGAAPCGNTPCMAGDGRVDCDPSARAAQTPRVVLFGGWDRAAGLRGDTWEWDGSHWTEKSVAGPPPRSRPAMATLNGRVVLFGGQTFRDGRDVDLGDTWEWDGSAWTEKKVPGPRPRSDAVMAAANGKLVLFGGFGGLTLADTWEWDGSQWTKRSVQGPSPRTHSAMASLNGKAILFSGYDHRPGETFDWGPQPGDTWEWDGSSWAQKASTGPMRRGFHSLASIGGRLVLSGGTGYRTFADTWEWDGSTWSSRSARLGFGPGSHVGQPMAGLDGRAVLPSGERTWTWDGEAWSVTTAAAPSLRESYGIATLP